MSTLKPFEITKIEGKTFHYILRGPGPDVSGILKTRSKKDAEKILKERHNKWCGRCKTTWARQDLNQPACR